MKNRKIFEYLRFFLHFSSSYIPSLSRTTDPYFNNARNKNTKNKKGAAIKNDEKSQNRTTIWIYWPLFSFIISLYSSFVGGMISSRSITQRNSEMTKGTTWNNNCVSQRVIFATIKPANALLDGKCAR